MKFFIDSADLDEIRDLAAAAGLVDGVTTNPPQGPRAVAQA
jgi:transaldolase